MATTAKRVKDAKKAQVFHAQAQPLQAVRTAARFSAQVRSLPLVLPAARAAGGDSRGFEVVLVRKSAKVAEQRLAMSGRFEAAGIDPSRQKTPLRMTT